MALFEQVSDLQQGAEVLRRRRYGVIEVADERLVRICLRPWPKRASWIEARLWGRWQHHFCPGNRCRLFYNEPRSAPGFLAVSYMVSTRATTWATCRGALCVLDEIARLKRADALVCDASNLRISDRLLKRWGWAPLGSGKLHRPFIKRFYGTYPPPDAALAGLLQSTPPAKSASQPRLTPSAQ
jgi:hypothetical protein